jgi:ankyrin repeat protein
MEKRLKKLTISQIKKVYLIMKKKQTTLNKSEIIYKLLQPLKRKYRVHQWEKDGDYIPEKVLQEYFSKEGHLNLKDFSNLSMLNRAAQNPGKLPRNHPNREILRDIKDEFTDLKDAYNAKLRKYNLQQLNKDYQTRLYNSSDSLINFLMNEKNNLQKEFDFAEYIWKQYFDNNIDKNYEDRYDYDFDYEYDDVEFDDLFAYMEDAEALVELFNELGYNYDIASELYGIDDEKLDKAYKELSNLNFVQMLNKLITNSETKFWINNDFDFDKYQKVKAIVKFTLLKLTKKLNDFKSLNILKFILEIINDPLSLYDFSINDILKSAVDKTNIQIVKLLLGYMNNNDLNFKYKKNGNTILMYTIDSIPTHRSPKDVDRLKIIKLLIDNGADVNIKDDNGNTSLIDACQHIYNQNPELIKLLIKNGADVNNRNKHGVTAIQSVAKSSGDDLNKKNAIEIVKLLIKNGADVNLSGHYHSTRVSPLEEAVLANNFEIAELLIKNGANVNSMGYYGTPLMKAQSVKMAKLLIENGADINIKKDSLPDRGKTAFEIHRSQMWPHGMIADFLKKHIKSNKN